MANRKITTLFSDIGGVLLTNGWDRHIRARAAEKFGFNLNEFEGRHQLCFYLYEIGKISLREYLHNTLFYEPRAFTMEEFEDFMYAQAEAYNDMVELVKSYKNQYGLKVVFLSNEGRELSDHRIKKFRLREIADFFVVSAFVALRKPDRAIYQLAIDLVQAQPAEIAYLEDRQLFVEMAAEMGIHAIKHVDYAGTKKALEKQFA